MVKNINNDWIPLFVFLVVAISLIIYFVLQQTVLKPITSTNITFSGLSVSGNKLVNEQKQQVILHGVDRSGAEYSCVKDNRVFDGPVDTASIQAMRTWHIDVVRIPLNEDCWLGINGVNPGGPVYQKAIENYVQALNQQGMYVILDLHWNAPGNTLATGQTNMADTDHSPAFWTSVANTFKNNTTVIFDLYNEPHDISWNCWKDSSNGNCGPYAGMNQLISAVRSTGATNVVMVGGLDWSKDLSQWLANKPYDPAGNIVASWHMYGSADCEGSGICWNTSVMTNLINHVPVIAGEFGESPYGSVCGTNIDNTLMKFLDQYKTGYVAWTWDTWGGGCGALPLITDYTGTPKSPNGIVIKNHYLKLGTTLTSSSVKAAATKAQPTSSCVGACPTEPLPTAAP